MSLTTSQKGEVRVVQLVINAVLNNVLENGRPSGHLIRLIVDALLTFDLPDFLTITLKEEEKE